MAPICLGKSPHGFNKLVGRMSGRDHRRHREDAAMLLALSGPTETAGPSLRKSLSSSAQAHSC